MKLILCVVSNDDSTAVQAALTSEGFFTTKLSSTGGFLKAGNTTFLIGADDRDVDRIIEVAGKYSKKRKTMMPNTIPSALYSGATVNTGTAPIEITVGGATVFVLNIERFEKM